MDDVERKNSEVSIPDAAIGRKVFPYAPFA
jgi:hypothetical protein